MKLYIGIVISIFEMSILQILACTQLSYILLPTNTTSSLTHFHLCQFNSSCYLGSHTLLLSWCFLSLLHHTLSCFTWPLLFLWLHLFLGSQYSAMHLASCSSWTVSSSPPQGTECRHALCLEYTFPRHLHSKLFHLGMSSFKFCRLSLYTYPEFHYLSLSWPKPHFHTFGVI